MTLRARGWALVVVLLVAALVGYWAYSRHVPRASRRASTDQASDVLVALCRPEPWRDIKRAAYVAHQLFTEVGIRTTPEESVFFLAQVVRNRGDRSCINAIAEAVDRRLEAARR